MESLLQFIYLGEAKFYEERMNEFLNVAKNLDIRELAKGIEDGDETTAVNEDNTGIDSEDTLVATEDVGEQRKQDIDGAAGAQHKTQSGEVTKGYKYECQQCHKAFTKTSNLTQHIQSVHEGVKYACNQCDHQATQQSNLTTHIQSVHEDVKYACNQCDYLATTQSNLTTHIKMKHRGVRYDCDHCDYQATQYSHLKTHILNKHKDANYRVFAGNLQKRN